jgi:hypothetical protein
VAGTGPSAVTDTEPPSVTDTEPPAVTDTEPPAVTDTGPDRQAALRPWPAPGPDAGWWRGEADEAGYPTGPDGTRTGPGGTPTGPSGTPTRPSGTADRPVVISPPGTSQLAADPPKEDPLAADLPGEDPLAADPPGEDPPAISSPAGGAVEPVVAAPVRLPVQLGDVVTAPPLVVPEPREDDPIWVGRPIDEWPEPWMKVRRPRRAAANRRVHRTKLTHRPLTGLTMLLLLALLAAFFAWFSAEPLWLSLGHGIRGTATVATCPVHGVDKRCADFASDDGKIVAPSVALLGSGQVAAGEKVSARMVSDRGWAAYTGSPYLRWIPGLTLVLLCGLGIAWSTGGYRLPGRRHRLAALAASLAGPLLLTVGMLAATW